MQFIKLKYHIIAAALILILIVNAACQKVINIKVDNAATQLVIEGNVTNQLEQQSVKISQSVPFTNTNTFPAVSGAVVTISDNKGNNYKLTEGTTAGTYLSNRFTGRTGNIYTLTVQTNGKTYTGSSTMPALVNFDQVTYRDDVFNGKNNKLMTVYFHDPTSVVNQYLFVMYVNNILIKTIFTSDDSFTNGGNVDLDLYQNDINILTGDAVIVEMQSIDRGIFTYWYSLSQQQNNAAGGGTAPSNPPSNLNNNALGYFSAHTVQKHTVIIN